MVMYGFQAVLFAQRYRFALWVPVWLGIGISIYFAIRFEPSALFISTVIILSSALALTILIPPKTLRILAWIPVFICVGFILAVFRAHSTEAPKLGWHYYGAVEGTVAHLDRFASAKPRVTLINPVLEKILPQKTPSFLRVSLHSKTPSTVLKPGACILITASLSPPAGPVEPGGFDFQGKAWFDRLGATGYSRIPAVLAEPANQNTVSLRIFALRMWL